MIDGPRGAVRIEPKAMAVLVELARHAGRVCSRDQIQQAVWPRGYTTDDVLTRCIGQIRKALGDDPRAPAYLETLPRRGYRLLQTVTVSNALTTSSVVDREPDSHDALIVLPFQYLSSDDDDYIADGITELLTARLAALRGITVLSRTTAMHFRDSTATVAEVARQTGAHWVIEGSVLQSGNRVQVVVQLIDAWTDAHIWAEDYIRDIGDILILQNDMAKKVAASIRVQLGATATSPAPPVILTSDTMRRYLLGRHLLSIRTVDALHRAIDQFSGVCESAPDYAPAWASRAEARFMLGHYGADSPAESYSSCRRDLEHALTRDPDLAIGLCCRGALRFAVEGNLDGAERDLLRALELMPGYSIAMLSLGNVYAAQGRFDEAMAWLDQALLVDPLDVGINMNVGDHLILQRRFDEAVDALEKAVDLAPDHRPSLLRMCWALALSGQSEAADIRLRRLGPTDDADWQWLEYAALVADANGQDALAQRLFRDLVRVVETGFVSPWSMARAATAAGEVEEALAWLRRAKEERSTSFPFAGVTPAFDKLREHAGFSDLVARTQGSVSSPAV